MGHRVMVVGSGGREHALIWQLAQSPQVEQVFGVPGNPGIADEPKAGSIARYRNAALDMWDVARVVALAKQQQIDLMVVGPEKPLCLGIVDAAREAGILVFGPTKQAAMTTEGSKCDAKDFMARHGIPTAPYRNFAPGNATAAKAFIREHPPPVVVKEDGLAAGKGVTIAKSRGEAVAVALRHLGNGKRIVVEQFLGNGYEASFTVITANQEVLVLATAQDHKRLEEGDRGEMTGGMGVISPLPFIDARFERRIMERIVWPTVRGLASEGIVYTGVLYYNLMIVAGEPYVLEINCRFGDPETQALMMRFKGDLYDVLASCAGGRLWYAKDRVAWDPRVAVCVVVAAHGYPDNPRHGDPIEGLEKVHDSKSLKVFHAGTKRWFGQLHTAGGRIFGVTALGATFRETREIANAACDKILIPGRQFRPDIGHQIIDRKVIAS